MLGLGNILLGDEGVGVHVVQQVAEMDLPDGVEAMDGGTAPADALATAEKAQRLIIIDALDVEGHAGEVYRLTPCQVVQSAANLSLHELSLERLQQTLRAWRRLPDEIVILGIVPGSIHWGTELSAELEAKLPQIVQAALSEVCRPHKEGAKHNDCHRAQAD